MSLLVQAADYLGNYALSSVVYFKFSVTDATGVLTTLGGTPAVKVYKDDGATESTAGVTLTVDFDSRTGLCQVAIDTSSDGTFYAGGHDFEAVITAGTVGLVSVAGTPVGHFSLLNRVETLANVSHGGSTATFTFKRMVGATTNSNPVLDFSSTGGNVGYFSSTADDVFFVDGGTAGAALNLYGSPGLFIHGPSNATPLQIFASGTGEAAYIQSVSGDAVHVEVNTLGNAVRLLSAGANKHDLNLAGSGDIVGQLAANALDNILIDGKTLRAALQIIAAMVAGKVSGAGTTTETFLGLDGITTRAVVTTDASGNRTAVSYP